MPEEEMVTITKKEYIKFLNESEFLRCLKNEGVDNWEGYEDASDNYKEIEEL